MPLTITSTFSPMTYDELSRPLIEQTAAHSELENSYAMLNDKAAALEAKANEQTDPVAYRQLKAYSESLQNQADQLMRVGLQRSSRQSLLDMKRRYSKEVLPVEEAVARRAALAEEQRKLALQNPDMLFERQAGNMSLDAFLANPQADYGSAYNGAMITKRVGEAVQAAAQGITSIQTDGHLTPYQIKVLKTHGFNPYEIERTIKGGGDANTLLQSIRDRVLNSIDVYQRGDSRTKERALDYANEGLRYGTGKSDYDLIKDEEALAELNFEYQKKLLNYKATQEAQAQAEALGAATNPQNIYSREETVARESNIDKYSKFFDKNPDGTYSINQSGIEELKRTVERPTPGDIGQYMRIPGPASTYTDATDFNRFMRSLGMKETTDSRGKKGFSIKDMNKAFTDYANNNYDASKLTEYNYQISPSEQEAWIQAVAPKANGKLRVADWDAKSKTWKKGSSVDISEALQDGGKISSVQYSAYGITMNITNKNGQSKRYILPSGINPKNEANLMTQLRGVQIAQEYYKSMGTDSEVVTPKEIRDGFAAIGLQAPATVSKADLQQLVKQLESSAMMYMSQLGNTNSNKATDWPAFGY